MDKFGVDENSKKRNLEKFANEGCPRCGRKVERHGQTLKCPTCGTEPFEDEDKH